MLAVIGDIVQDIVVWQREKVRPATDTASDIFIQRGGSAANVAAFAGPRTPTRFIGCVGDDLAGLVLTRELESHGVEVKNQVRGADGATGTIVLQIDLDGERSMFPSRGASAMLTTIDPAWVAGVDLLHLTAYSFETPGPRDAVIEAAARVHAHGGRVCLDVSSVFTIESLGEELFCDTMLAIAPDYLSANADETVRLALADGERPGPALARMPQTMLLARHGAEATHVLTGDGLVCTVPVEPAEEIKDLTGAGDAFNAGFLASLVNDGPDAERNVRAAHALSRRVLASPGATEPDD